MNSVERFRNLAIVVAMAAALQLLVPRVSDLVEIAHAMRADERAQFVALSGAPAYDPDAAVRAFLGYAGAVFMLADAQRRPVVVGGFEPARPGVFDVWQAGTDAGWAQHGRSITRWSGRLIRDVLKGGAHRLQVTALASRTQAHAWYEALGFECEGVRRGYCADGQDAITFVRCSPRCMA